MLGLVAGLFLLTIESKAIYVEYPGVMAVGVVTRSAAIGGEGTGWIITISQPIQIDGNNIKSIDLVPGSNSPRWLAGRRVLVSGTIEFRSGTERGIYPVLVATSITPVRYFGPVAIPASAD